MMRMEVQFRLFYDQATEGALSSMERKHTVGGPYLDGHREKLTITKPDVHDIIPLVGEKNLDFMLGAVRPEANLELKVFVQHCIEIMQFSRS